MVNDRNGGTKQLQSLSNSSRASKSEHIVDNLYTVASMADTSVLNGAKISKLSYFLCGIGNPIDDR